MNQIARDTIRRVLAEADGFAFECLEPHDYQRHVDALLTLFATAAVVSPPPSRAALRDRIAEAVDRIFEAWQQGLGESRPQDAIADAVLAVLPVQDDRAAVLLEAADHLLTLKTPPNYVGVHGLMFSNGVQAAGEELRRLAVEARPAGTQQREADADPKCLCGHPTRLHHEDACLLTGCGCADSLEISALPEALEAVLTKRFTELGNQFAEMRVHEQGPDGWPSSRLVSPRMVAEVLRELMATKPAPVAQQLAADDEETRRG